MNKRKKIAMHKLFCYNNLYLELLDELKPTTPKMIDFRENLIGFCEELNNTLADTDTVLKSTYFNDIAKKIDTIMRKEFDENM